MGAPAWSIPESKERHIDVFSTFQDARYFIVDRTVFEHNLPMVISWDSFPDHTRLFRIRRNPRRKQPNPHKMNPGHI